MKNENQESRDKNQDKTPAKIRLDLFKGIMHSLQRFEFLKGDDETLIFWDNKYEEEIFLNRSFTLPDLINWIVELHELESFDRGERGMQEKIRKALGIETQLLTPNA